MADLKIYAIRKAILRDLKRYVGAPITAAELIEISIEPAIRYADKAAALEQFGELKQHGYIEPIPAFGGEYCEISVTGLRQLSPEFPQDPFVHGPGAVK